jgi:hypothetical protein
VPLAAADEEPGERVGSWRLDRSTLDELVESINRTPDVAHDFRRDAGECLELAADEELRNVELGCVCHAHLAGLPVAPLSFEADELAG